jgi:hypothetical protein
LKVASINVENSPILRCRGNAHGNARLLFISSLKFQRLAEDQTGKFSLDGFNFLKNIFGFRLFFVEPRFPIYSTHARVFLLKECEIV